MGQDISIIAKYFQIEIKTNIAELEQDQYQIMMYCKSIIHLDMTVNGMKILIKKI